MRKTLFWGYKDELGIQFNWKRDSNLFIKIINLDEESFFGVTFVDAEVVNMYILD